MFVKFVKARVRNARQCWGELIKAVQPNPARVEFSTLSMNNKRPDANCSISANAVLNWEER